MCCSAERDLTLAFLRANKGKKFVTVYKVLSKTERGSLLGPYQYTPYRPGEYFVPDLKRHKHKRSSIYYGIHVFLTKKAAQKLRKTRTNNVVVEMTALVQDVIGVGTFNAKYKDNAVFRRVFLSESEYNRVSKIRKR